MIEQRLKDTAKLFVVESFFESGTGLDDGSVIVLVGEHARVERPLPATPGPSLVDGAPGLRIVEDAVSLAGLHLDHRTGHSPVTRPGFFTAQTKRLNHSLLIAFVKGDGGFPVATETATGACKYIGDLAGLSRDIVHGKKKRRSRGAGAVKEKERENYSRCIKRSR